jgi:enamine deaminase RidA (YjgF/YER057c/UK114 family)
MGAMTKHNIGTCINYSMSKSIKVTDPPARSALGANGLALGARVEVDCLAFVPTPSEG